MTKENPLETTASENWISESESSEQDNKNRRRILERHDIGPFKPMKKRDPRKKRKLMNYTQRYIEAFKRTAENIKQETTKYGRSELPRAKGHY